MTSRPRRAFNFEVRSYRADDYASLLHMYDCFTPKARFQGMPPRDGEERKRWISMLVRKGESFLAWEQAKVIGHVVLLPDFKKGDAEYLIFVNQAHRGCGVGTELTRAALRRAAELGLRTVWLTVDAYNFRATRLYRKFGFQFCDTYRSESERMMTYNCGSNNGT